MTFAGFALFLAVTALCGLCIAVIKPKDQGDDHHHGHGHGHGHGHH